MACSVTTSLTAPQPSGGDGLLGTPSVIVDGGDVFVFAYYNGAGNDDGEAGWISTDGGNTFKVEVRLSKPGKGLLAKDGGHLTATILVGVKVGGTTVTGHSHSIRIKTKK